MSNPSLAISDLFTAAEAGAYLGGIKPATLAVWRSWRINLPFLKLAGIRYRKSDLDNFLASRLVTPEAPAQHHQTASPAGMTRSRDRAHESAMQELRAAGVI